MNRAAIVSAERIWRVHYDELQVMCKIISELFHIKLLDHITHRYDFFRIIQKSRHFHARGIECLLKKQLDQPSDQYAEALWSLMVLELWVNANGCKLSV